MDRENYLRTFPPYTRTNTNLFISGFFAGNEGKLRQVNHVNSIKQNQTNSRNGPRFSNRPVAVSNGWYVGPKENPRGSPAASFVISIPFE